MICKVCGEKTEPKKRDRRGWSRGYRKTCSNACLLALASFSGKLGHPDRKEIGPPPPCEVCGTPTRKYGKNSAYRKTCSAACNGKLERAHRKGEASALWRGGRRASRERTRKKYPERHLARRAVLRAIRVGRLIRQPCQVCGEANSEAHHENYSKALDVVWLCRPHHMEADRRLGLGRYRPRKSREKPSVPD